MVRKVGEGVGIGCFLRICMGMGKDRGRRGDQMYDKFIMIYVSAETIQLKAFNICHLDLTYVHGVKIILPACLLYAKSTVSFIPFFIRDVIRIRFDLNLKIQQKK